MAEKNVNAQINVEFEKAASRQSLDSGDSINTLFGKIKKFFSDLKAVAFSGSYNDLSDTPTSLPASDVAAWAKAATKPTYTASEVGADPAGTATSKINALDVSDTAVAGKYVSSVSETNGKISVTRSSLPDYSNTYDAKGSADEAFTSAKSYIDKIDKEVKAINTALDNKANSSHTHTLSDITDYPKHTISSSSASGGSNGDIWFKY